MWYGFAARARILLVNTRLVAEADRPTGLTDLVSRRWKGKIGIAKPLFGTTATHAACLFAAWGDDKARKFFQRFESQRGSGSLGQQAGRHGRGLRPDRRWIDRYRRRHGRDRGRQSGRDRLPRPQPGQLGTLFIPNTLAMIKGAPHPQAAARLADLILSPEVEARLADGPSGRFRSSGQRGNRRVSKRRRRSIPWRSISRKRLSSGTASPRSSRRNSRASTVVRRRWHRPKPLFDSLSATRWYRRNCVALPAKEVTTPAVLPAVPYRGVRRRQRRGAKPSGQRILTRRVAIGARAEIATASTAAVGDQGRVVWPTQVNRRKRRKQRQAKGADRLGPKR